MKTKIEELYEEWCGEDRHVNDCHPVHDSSETIEFAEYYFNELTKWIPVEEELPETPIIVDGINYSEYLNIKVVGYKHPFVAFYIRANDDEFFDLIHLSLHKDITQDKITHWRPIEFK